MKRKVLFSMMALSATLMMAQKDVTPGRYVFANQPVGKFEFCDEVHASANPPAPNPKVETGWKDGYIAMCNGQFSSMTAPNVLAVTTGSSIVDMGGEVGKVFCIKGKDSTFPYGITSENGFGIGWYNIRFYAPQEEIAQMQNVRFTLVCKIIQNNPADMVYLKTEAYTAGSVTRFNATKEPNPSFSPTDFIQRYPEDNEPVLDDDENYMNDDEIWLQSEFDFKAAELAGLPLSFQLGFGPTAVAFNNTTILIKTIKMETDPVGEPEKMKTVKLKWDTSSVGFAKTEKSMKMYYTAGQNKVTLHNLTYGQDVAIYSVNGQVVNKFIANETNTTLSLQSGFYIVKSGSDIIKVVIE